MSANETAIVMALAVGLCLAAAPASMVVTQDLPTTAWPDGVTFDTVGGDLTYTSGYGVGSNQRLSQTFVVPVSGLRVLDKISIGYDAMFGDNGYQIFLYEVADAMATTYTVGTSLFGTLTFDTPGPRGDYIMTFDFEGPDEITLTAGQAYAFEILGPTTNWRLQWRQPGAVPGDLYPDGSPYVNRSQVFDGARDFTMGVHLVAEPLMGDADGDGDVDLDDFAILKATFGQSPLTDDRADFDDDGDVDLDDFAILKRNFGL